MPLRCARKYCFNIMRVLFVTLLSICALLPFAAFPRIASAARRSPIYRGTPITVTTRSQAVNFPNSINFDVTVTDTSSNITTATIFFSYYPHGISAGSTDLHHDVPVDHPARTITLHDSEDTSGSGFVLPGTPIDYYWQFQDSASHTFNAATKRFIEIDSRFTWQHLSQGKIQINWYNQPQNFGQVVLKHATDSLAHISKVVGAEPAQPINLWIYGTFQDFRASLGPAEYEWVGGEAFPDLSQTFLVIQDTSDYTLARDMPHEMTHLVFHQLTAHANVIPSWFDEGLAVYNQMYHEPEMTARLQKALDTQTLLSLDEISGGFPPDADKAYLAYAQSWNLVAYMYSTFGQARMTALIKALNSPLIDFEGAAQQALGIDVAHLENQWHIHLHQPPTLTGGQPGHAQPAASRGPSGSDVFTTTSVILIVVVLASVLLVVISGRRRRRVLAKPTSPPRIQ